MVRTHPEPNEREGERGFALVLAIFLLAMASALGLIIGSNGFSARKSARMASYRSAAVERAALATWMAADALEQPQKSSRFVFSIMGRDVSAELSPETGRIDLNGLPASGLAQAIQQLGYEPAIAKQAAEVLSDWKGPLQPDARSLSTRLPDARQALWSIDDLDAVDNLGAGIKACLKLWGTVHARGPFLHHSLEQPLSMTSEIGDTGNIVVGSTIRIVVLDQFTGMKFRTILLYRGGRANLSGQTGGSRSSWLVMEWLSFTTDSVCETPG